MLMFSRIFFRFLLLVVGLGALMLVSSFDGEAQTLRAAQHAGFGRMVFDWGSPVEYSADVVDGRLVVRFDRAIDSSLRPILGQLPSYVRAGSISDDRRSVTFPLTNDFRLEASRNGTAVVIDLKPAGATAPTAAAPAPNPTSPPSAAAAPAPVAATPTAPKEAGEIMMRVGNHTGYSRLVFDWPSTIPYTVDQNGSLVTLSFGKEATINTKAARTLPEDITLGPVSVSGGKTTVQLTIPVDARARHFRVGTKIALDVARSAQGAAPQQQAADGVPLAPAPGSAQSDAPPSVVPAPIMPVASTPLSPSVADGGVTGVGAFAGARPPDRSAIQSTGRSTQGMPPPLALPPEAIPPSSQASVQPSEGAGVVAEPVVEQKGRLVFRGRKASGLAMFRRAGWLWFVFDQAPAADLDQLRAAGGDMIQKIESVPLPGGLALRLLVDPKFNPEARSEENGKVWTISLLEHPLQPKVSMTMSAATDAPLPKLILGTGMESQARLIDDPEVGDRIRVVTVTTPGLGIADSYTLTDIILLPTAQGVAVISLSDNVEVLPSQQVTEITVVGTGLRLSEAELRGDSAPPPPASDGSLLDIPLWYGNLPFQKENQLLRSAVDALGERNPVPTQEERNKTRMALIHHLLAHGREMEALGELGLMAQEDPKQVDTPVFRAVRGAANYLMGRFGEAVDDLSNPELKKDSSAALWLALAKAQIEPPASQAEAIKNNVEILKLYPKNLKLRLGQDALRIAIAGKDSQTALALQKIMTDETLDDEEKALVSYARARVQELLNGNVDDIAKLYELAENSESRLIRALAGRAKIDLLLRNKKISVKGAIEGYERLRFSWRGGDFEFDLLKRLGELYMQAGDYPNGLRTLRDLASGFSSHKGTSDVVQAMRDAFVRLYLDGQADSMQPLTAIALYNEFQELLPSGAKGDQLIQRLADRLVAVDLLNEAAALLQQQVQNRLSGVDKGRVGARLALIHVLNQQPEKALEALKASEVNGMSLDLLGQRRRLKARALADMGQHNDALALLAGDETRDADILRSEIFWKNGNWREAADALKVLVETTVKDVEAPIDDGTAGIIVDWATALILAGDEDGLSRMRRLYGERMANTEFHDEFQLLTAENELGIPDYRSVPGKIKQVEDFRSSYLKKLRDEGLSAAIN